MEAEEVIYDVDPIFEPYVQAFVDEAAMRGIDIDYRSTGLTMRLSEVAQTDASGRCFTRDNVVEINKAVWVQGFENFKTRLIFHELGHCTLNRRHRNDRFDNGLWKSNMRGSPLSDAELQIPIPYFGFRIPYYNDELFDQFTPDPDWAFANFDFTEVSEESKMQFILEDSLSRFRSQVNQEFSEYELEFVFDYNMKNTQSTILKWGNGILTYGIYMYPTSEIIIVVEEGPGIQGLYRDRFGAFVDEKLINKITIRRHGGFEKIFMNEKFIFHLDQLEGSVRSVSFESLENGTNQFDNDFQIHSIQLSELVE